MTAPNYSDAEKYGILFDPFCWRLLAVQHLRCFCFCLIFILIPVQTYDLSLKP